VRISGRNVAILPRNLGLTDISESTKLPNNKMPGWPSGMIPALGAGRLLFKPGSGPLYFSILLRKPLGRSVDDVSTSNCRLCLLTFRNLEVLIYTNLMLLDI